MEGDVNNMDHQKHYKNITIEPIDVMWQTFSKDEMVGFLKGNVLKYTMRYKEKNKLEDLDKAAVYLEWLRRREADLPRVGINLWSGWSGQLGQSGGTLK
jgi:hypothetical protein